MSSVEPNEGLPTAAAAETDTILPGALVEDMQTGLMRILGLEQTFAAIRDYQQGFIEDVVDMGQVQESIEELQRTLAGEATQGSQLFEFLGKQFLGEHGDKPNYNPNRLGRVGYAAILLGAQDPLIASERQAWAEGSVAREWLGEAVALRRPPAAVTSEDDNWGKRGPLYRGLERGEPISRYYRGGDIADFHGKLQHVSLEQGGRVILDLGNREETEIIELFEEIRDPETDVVTGYVPRLSIDRVSRPARIKRNLRNAAIERLGPEIPDIS